MPLVAPVPVSRYLVPPGEPALPPSFSTARIALTAGIPYTYALDARWSVILRYPTGVMNAWTAADPGDVASSDAPERAPRPDGADDGPRDPVRLTVALDKQTRAVVPLTAGRRALIADDGANPAALELAILSWTITAGSVRGRGDSGAALTLAWRDATRAVDVFAPPPLPPLVALRLPRLANPPILLVMQESMPATLFGREMIELGERPVRRTVTML
jgi:hypothetical protein